MEPYKGSYNDVVNQGQEEVNSGCKPQILDEFNGVRGEFYKNMFAKCPAGRSGTVDEVKNVAELLMSEKGVFITETDFLCDGVKLKTTYVVL